ncbi:hypothetical protein BDV59DRAFT_189417 [Aspergillus ambiguus]|uniref:uncharacterized protein n=1 Tax=Aspergillus ambiguus TaxID=176160 RepID=UPI003CCD1588
MSNEHSPPPEVPSWEDFLEVTDDVDLDNAFMQFMQDDSYEVPAVPSPFGTHPPPFNPYITPTYGDEQVPPTKIIFDQESHGERRPRTDSTEARVRSHLDELETTITRVSRERLERLDLQAIKERLNSVIRTIDTMLTATEQPVHPPTPPPGYRLRKDYKCIMCLTPPLSKGAFSRHVRDNHRSSNLYKCPVCGLEGRRRDKILIHIRQLHNTQLAKDELSSIEFDELSPFNCEVCHRAFDTWDQYFNCLLDHCRLLSSGSSLEGNHGSVAPSAPIANTNNEVAAFYECPSSGTQRPPNSGNGVTPQDVRFAEAYGAANPAHPEPRSFPGVEFTDSGYAASTNKDQRSLQASEASVAFDSIGKMNGQSQHPSSTGGARNITQNIQSGYDDDMSTIYSDSSSIPEPVKDNYIMELAEELAKATRPFQPTGEVLKRLSENLPDLLRTFSLGLGHSESSQMHLNVMVFLHKYRTDIGAELVDRLADKQEDDDHNPRNKEKMQLDEIMSFWHSKGSPEPVSGVYPQPNITEYREKGLVASERAGSSTDSNLPQLEAYRNLILNSPWYRWLVDKLQRECVLAPSEPNTMEEIRDTILALLPLNLEVSKRRPEGTLEVLIRVNWDPAAFYNEQNYTESPRQALERAITLTGWRGATQALTCSQYMEQTWPSTGTKILRLITNFVSGIHNASSDTRNRDEADHQMVTLPDGTSLRAFREAPQDLSNGCTSMWLKICGLAESVAEVGEQVAWLGCALRSSPAETGITYCRPFVDRLCEGPRSEGFGSDTPHVFGIDFVFHAEENIENFDGSCWHGLFKNPVVVEGYPTARRPEPDAGLEIPLPILSGLTRTRRVNTFDGKLVLKGYSFILIPTKFYQDIVMWHLIYRNDDERISYAETESFPSIDISGSVLEKSRHILGWCSDMQLYAGTAEACYGVQETRLRYPSGESAFANVSISTGHLISQGMPFSIGAKDIHPRRNCYAKKIKWIFQKFLVLWDIETKRGWLVNGASALLHLLRASLEQEKQSKFGRRLLFDPKELHEASDPHQHESALEVLLDESNIRLKVYSDKNGFVYLEDRIEDFYDILEKIFDYELRSDYSHIPRSWLDGWDFSNLASELDPVYPRRAIIEPEGRSWVDFTRSIHALPLLGRNFGEIIRPSTSICPFWASLPKGKSYLAASVADLRNIMRACGGDPYDTPVRLTNNIVWYTSQSTAVECRCVELGDSSHSDLAQVILPSELSRGDGTCTTYEVDKGAVFFGSNSNHKWLWKDKGDPSLVEQEGSRNGSIPPEKVLMHAADSGFGSAETTPSELNGNFGMTARKSSSLADVPSTNPSFTSTSTKDYTIGIVCALPLEFRAVRILFDEIHPVIIPDADTHAYALGRMGKHHVVAAGLPKGRYGTISAAAVASDMRRSFSAIKVCLLVGIGGGVSSSKHDIRLGDVVVSTPTGPYSGVLAYDMVKIYESGQVQLNGCLSRPAESLLSAITTLTSESELQFLEVQGCLDHIKTSCPEYEHPGPAKDILFASGYIHEDTSTCETCDRCDLEYQVERNPRGFTQPRIHYGLVASGNQLMRSAKIRDQISQKYDVLCFEMEGAGIMDTFPCLVIRGICDYADSHKNELWQNYAAAAAAAYAKVLLSRVRALEDWAECPRKRKNEWVMEYSKRRA